jgi:hypothetical protein
MPKADKKQRHKAKREAKRRQAQRQKSISPIKRLADAPGEIEYWMSDDFDGLGQSQMFVYKRAAGLTGIACFLVDRGVVGLKDAWARVHIEKAEFNDMLEECRDRGIPMRHATLDEVRRMVAGGIRWAHDNGMRLPKDWVKPAALLGGINDWMTADVSAFVKEFAGHPDDLRQRLISEPFESYIERDDIDFDFSELAPYMNQETGDYVHPDGSEDDDLDEEEFEGILTGISDAEMVRLTAALTLPATALADETVLWLTTRHGEEPSPELIPAWQSFLLVTLLTEIVMPSASADERADFEHDALQEMVERFDEARSSEYEDAIEQLLEHLDAEPTVLQKAMMKYRPVVDLDESSKDQEGGQ